MMRIALIISLLVSLYYPSKGQDPHPILTYFRANLSGNSVHLSWEIKGGNQCNGIQIYRSSDTLNWNLIGDIQGICGSPDFPQQYSFIDESPLPNQVNYYRLELGAQGFSTYASVHYIVLNNQGYNLFPNPITASTSIHFSNPNGRSYTLRIFDQSGREVYTTSQIKSNEVTIGDFDQKGSFIFILQAGESPPVRGTFLSL